MDHGFGLWLYAHMFQAIPALGDPHGLAERPKLARALLEAGPGVEIQGDTLGLESRSEDLLNWVSAEARRQSCNESEVATALCLAALDRIEANMPDTWPPDASHEPPA